MCPRETEWKEETKAVTAKELPGSKSAVIRDVFSQQNSRISLAFLSSSLVFLLFFKQLFQVLFERDLKVVLFFAVFGLGCVTAGEQAVPGQTHTRL